MSEPVRVLQVVTHMNRGGLESMLMNYYRHIDRDVLQFDFLAHREYKADFDDEIESLGGRIYHLRPLNPWSKDYLKSLNLFFREHKEYRVVHVHQDCMSSVILEAAKKNGVPVRIAHSHAAGQDKNLKYPLKIWYKRAIPKYATTLFACGREAGEWMFGSADFTVFNNAIPAKEYIFNPEKRKKVRTEFQLEDEYLIGLTGRFSPQKNHVFLIDIFYSIYQREASAKLMLIGEGGLREEIESKCRQLGILDRVIFTGLRTDVPDLLQAMDVFVMPSNYEGLSLASLEAQAAGLPCFISDKVPIECKKTDLVWQIPLSESPDYWAERILSTRNMPRRNTYEEIKKSGFDVEQNARWLQELYLSDLN